MSHINWTVPQMLRANVPVSDERLESELRSMTRTARYYIEMDQRERRGTPLPSDYVPPQHHLQSFLDDLVLVEDAIEERDAFAQDTSNTTASPNQSLPTHQHTDSPNTSRINRTIPDLLRAGIQVSGEELAREVHMLERSVQFHLEMRQRRIDRQVRTGDYYLSDRQWARLGDEWDLVGDAYELHLLSGLLRSVCQYFSIVGR
jgi:hypothetical protein